MPDPSRENPAPPPAKYSWLQYFFWLVAGVEIGILKKYRTDYNRQAAIGATIFMTALFAGLAGGYAAYYFTRQNITVTVCFGLLWGCMIFVLDRSLVVSLKKGRQYGFFQLIFPFLIRAALAALIAMVIAVPVELLVFSDDIEMHLERYRYEVIKQTTDLAGASAHTGDARSLVLEDSAEMRATAIERQRGEPAGDDHYNALARNYYAALRSEQRIRQQEADQAEKANDVTLTEQQKQNHAQRAQALRTEASDAHANVTYAGRSVDAYTRRWRDSLDNALHTQRGKLAMDLERQHNGQVFQDSARIRVDLVSRNQNGFLSRYVVLQDLAAGTDESSVARKHFMWLLQLMFFVIEILPTLLKLMTPSGAYDRGMENEERASW